MLEKIQSRTTLLFSSMTFTTIYKETLDQIETTKFVYVDNLYTHIFFSFAKRKSVKVKISVSIFFQTLSYGFLDANMNVH